MTILATNAVKNANPVYMITRLLAALAFVAGLAGCGEDDAAPPRPGKTAADYFTINVGGQPVQMQLAVATPDDMRELNRGLMGRRDLAEDQGMIFIYQAPQQMGFYMRNTPTPLDIGFFTVDGILREVRQMFPFDETTVMSARSDIWYALEMNQGWYARHGVKPASLGADDGAKIDLKALAAALKARGFKPAEYGLVEFR